MRRWVPLSLATLFVASRALGADPREQQLAQALFDEGRQLMEQKRYPEACPKLAESQRLDPGGGTLLNLAVCHEKEGKIATAHAEYHEALSIAIRDARKDRQDLARERIAAIEPRIPRVTVTVAAAADVEGLDVKLDGLGLRRAAWGVAAPVDPGLHRIEATAPGRAPWSVSVPVEVKDRKVIEVPVLAPEGQPSVSAPVPVTAPPAAENVVGPVAPPMVDAAPMKPNPLFIVAVGVTAVAAAASAVTGILALQANSTAKDGCLPERHFCANQDAVDAAGRARTFAWVSTGTLVLAAAGGASLLLIPTTTRAGGAQIGAIVVPGGGGLKVGRAF
jgi:hypothetical protein